MQIKSLNLAKTNLFEDLVSASQSLDLFESTHSNVPILSDVIKQNQKQLNYYFMRTPFVEAHQIQTHLT